MKRKLLLGVLSAVTMLGITSAVVLNKPESAGLIESTTDVFNNTEVMTLKNLQVGESEEIKTSKTYVQYGEKDGIDYLRFATAVSGPIGSATYTRSGANTETETKEIKVAYQGVVASGGTLYYNDNGTTDEEKLSTSEEYKGLYYWVCYTIGFETDTHKDTEFTLSLEVKDESGNVATTASRSASLNSVLDELYPVKTTVLEAEDAIFEFAGLCSDDATASGGRYLGFINSSNNGSDKYSFIRYEIDSAKTQDVVLNFRFAIANTDPAKRNFTNDYFTTKINGVVYDVENDEINYEGETGWTAWYTLELGTTQLLEGRNTITFKAVPGAVSNVDYLSIDSKYSVSFSSYTCEHKNEKELCTNYDCNYGPCLTKDETGWNKLNIHADKTTGTRSWISSEDNIGWIDNSTSESTIIWSFEASEDTYVRLALEHSTNLNETLHFENIWDLKINDELIHTDGTTLAYEGGSYHDFVFSTIAYVKVKAGLNTFEMQHKATRGYNIRSLDLYYAAGTLSLPSDME